MHALTERADVSDSARFFLNPTSPMSIPAPSSSSTDARASGSATSGDTAQEGTPPRREQLDPGTRPMSSRASKAFVIGAFLFIFGLGTVGSILLVDVAETALDQEPVAPDSVEKVAPTPGEGNIEDAENAADSSDGDNR